MSVLTDSWAYYYCSDTHTNAQTHSAGQSDRTGWRLSAMRDLFFNTNCFHYAFFANPPPLSLTLLVPPCGACNCNFCCLRIYDHQWAPEASDTVRQQDTLAAPAQMELLVWLHIPSSLPFHSLCHSFSLLRLGQRVSGCESRVKIIAFSLCLSSRMRKLKFHMGEKTHKK